MRCWADCGSERVRWAVGGAAWLSSPGSDTRFCPGSSGSESSEVELLLLLLMGKVVDRAVVSRHRHRRREVNVKRKDYSDVSYFFLDVDYMEDNPAGS